MISRSLPKRASPDKSGASVVEVPKQRNSRDENNQIKKGETPEAWLEQPNKL